MPIWHRTYPAPAGRRILFDGTSRGTPSLVVFRVHGGRDQPPYLCPARRDARISAPGIAMLANTGAAAAQDASPEASAETELSSFPLIDYRPDEGTEN